MTDATNADATPDREIRNPPEGYTWAGTPDGRRFIECHTCGHRSFDWQDIEQTYCPVCRKYHFAENWWRTRPAAEPAGDPDREVPSTDGQPWRWKCGKCGNTHANTWTFCPTCAKAGAEPAGNPPECMCCHKRPAIPLWRVCAECWDRTHESPAGVVRGLRYACTIALECFGDEDGETAKRALEEIQDASDRYDHVCAAEPAGDHPDVDRWTCQKCGRRPYFASGQYEPVSDVSLDQLEKWAKRESTRVSGEILCLIVELRERRKHAYLNLKSPNAAEPAPRAEPPDA